MDCTLCNIKGCRSLSDCKAQKTDSKEVRDEYIRIENQGIVQSAAKLVDNGRAGNLSRLDEIIDFIFLKNYKTVGVAYCYGMEIEASMLTQVLRSIDGIRLVAVSCTTGALAQDAINEDSCIHNVSCNPIAQASQLKKDGVDFVITMGLCLGHDILFNRYNEADTTTFVVKDRVNNHNPILGLIKTALKTGNRGDNMFERN